MNTKTIFVIFLVLFSIYWTPCQSKTDNGLTIKDITVKDLQNTYTKYGYEHHIAVRDYHIPQIYLEHFPSDFNSIKNTNERNETFIKILTPIALKINQEIMQERSKLLKIETNFQKNGKLTEAEEKQLEDFAKKYDVFTHLKNNLRHQYHINQLKIKINQVYPSLLIAIAAIETDWGTSRIVKEANSLYKELVWHSTEGLEPIGETEDHTYKIKIFPNLYESMKSFALKFNSNVSYEHARFLRNLRHTKGILPSGKGIVHSMLFQTPLQNYVNLLDYTITFYKLSLLDQAPLSPHAPKEVKRIKKTTKK